MKTIKIVGEYTSPMDPTGNDGTPSFNTELLGFTTWLDLINLLRGRGSKWRLEQHHSRTEGGDLTHGFFTQKICLKQTCCFVI